MKKITMMVALLIGATCSLGAMPIVENNVNQSEVYRSGSITAYINAGTNRVTVTVPNGTVVGVMPGMLQWTGGGSTITVTNLNKMFDTSTPGTSFTFDVGVIIDGVPTHNGVSAIYTVIVYVQ